MQTQTPTKIQAQTRVWDFATSSWAIVVEVQTYFDEDEQQEYTFYTLDASVPLSEEYPTTYRNRFEIGLTPTDDHGTIYSPRTQVSLVGEKEEAKFVIKEPTLN